MNASGSTNACASSSAYSRAWRLGYQKNWCSPPSHGSPIRTPKRASRGSASRAVSRCAAPGRASRRRAAANQDSRRESSHATCSIVSPGSRPTTPTPARTRRSGVRNVHDRPLPTVNSTQPPSPTPPERGRRINRAATSRRSRRAGGGPSIRATQHPQNEDAGSTEPQPAADQGGLRVVPRSRVARDRGIREPLGEQCTGPEQCLSRRGTTHSPPRPPRTQTAQSLSQSTGLPRTALPASWTRASVPRGILMPSMRRMCLAMAGSSRSASIT